MRTPRDLLERFRPAGTPGAAGPAGVPVDRAALLREELQPVLDLLAATDQQCAEIRSTARHGAESLRAGADAVVASTLARARSDADVARSAAAAEQRRTSDELAAADLRHAEAEAGRIHAVSRQRRPPLVARAVRLAEAELGLARRTTPAGRDR
jgi:hypothetical protein